MIVQILEAVMLICFGLSWPLNLYKSIKSKSTKGKSLFFLILIDLGYVAGTISKVLNKVLNGVELTWVLGLYILNFVMVSADLVLYFINLSREKREEK